MTTTDPVLEALEKGLAYIKAVEGTVPIKPNLVTPDRERVEKAIAIQKQQMAVIEAARLTREFYVEIALHKETEKLDQLIADQTVSPADEDSPPHCSEQGG